MGEENLKETGALFYREYRREDLSSVLELWEKYSGWGAITEQQFKEWNFNTPYGDCLIIVAETGDKEIVGQIAFIPSIMYSEGKDVKAYRVMAPILNPMARGLDIQDYNHPIWGLFRRGIGEVKKMACSLVYLQPAKGWLKLEKLFPLYGMPKSISFLFDCVAIALKDPTTFPAKINSGVEFKIGEFSTEYDALWEKFLDNFQITLAVKRDSNWLKWKRNKNLLYELRNQNSGELKGYIILKKDSGLILDVIGESLQDIEEIIDHLIYHLHSKSLKEPSASINELKFIKTPFVDKILLNKITHDVPFQFAFGCMFLMDAFEIRLDHFYLMPDD